MGLLGEHEEEAALGKFVEWEARDWGEAGDNEHEKVKEGLESSNADC